VRVAAAAPLSIAFSQNSVVGGAPTPVYATVTESGPFAAQFGQVYLNNCTPQTAYTPSGITPAPGQTKFAFRVYSHGVSAPTYASFQAEPVTTTGVMGVFLVLPADLASLDTANKTVTSRMATRLVLSLNGYAAPAGAKVLLKSSDPSILAVPASMTIGYDHSANSFLTTVGKILPNQTVTITATFGTTVKTLTLTGS
jgi:hypothetical protein